MIDVAKLRADTPSCEFVCHLNNAGSALPPRVVVDRVVEHLRLEEQIGGYEAHAQVEVEIERVYESIARLIGANTAEIAVVESATQAWSAALRSLSFGAGDRILTCASEYASNAIALLQVCKRTGASLEVVPDDAHGQIDLAALEALLDERVRLVSIVYIPTQGGLVNPVADVARLARRVGALVLVDACQAVGQLPIDVRELDCDFLSATGRKFLRGPRGTGFLYVREQLISALEPFPLDLHSATWTSATTYEPRMDAKRFEYWERSYAGMLGLGVAVEYAQAIGVPAMQTRVRMLAERLRTGLAERPGVAVADLGVERGAIVTFAVDGADHAAIAASLRASGINISVTARAAAVLDLGRRNYESLLRASPHAYNTEAEVDRLLAAL